MPINHHDATFYVQIEPEWSSYANREGERALTGIKATAITQKRPTRPRHGAVLTKLTVRIPDAAFLPLRPEVIVVIPEDMVVTSPIEVEAGNPDD